MNEKHRQHHRDLVQRWNDKQDHENMLRLEREFPLVATKLKEALKPGTLPVLLTAYEPKQPKLIEILMALGFKVLGYCTIDYTSSYNQYWGILYPGNVQYADSIQPDLQLWPEDTPDQLCSETAQEYKKNVSVKKPITSCMQQ